MSNVVVGEIQYDMDAIADDSGEPIINNDAVLLIPMVGDNIVSTDRDLIIKFEFRGYFRCQYNKYVSSHSEFVDCAVLRADEAKDSGAAMEVVAALEDNLDVVTADRIYVWEQDNNSKSFSELFIDKIMV